ncbi:ABC transporter permease subunit [Phycisphaerales bacterium AB-hyl4]|uniref:ABC transporter permease subunit n=1 Tax=Natronomicrosphaera hydrolytica TaxID=3242702 RepID=A0ABV4UAK0_9BACT
MSGGLEIKQPRIELTREPRDAPPADGGPPPKRSLRRRAPAGSSLTAHGEPMVWLIGGGLAICAFMIIGLLILIAWQGSATFWPKPIVMIETIDGQHILGEPTRSEYYEPRVEVAADDVEGQAEPEMLASTVVEDGLLGLAHRRLIRVGNREFLGTPFRWVTDDAVANETQPTWAVLVERRTWGPFIGKPSGFRVNGKTVADNADEAWAQFQTYHVGVLQRRDQRRQLETYDTGEVNHVLERSRLAVRRAELAVVRADRTEGQDSSRYATARERYDQARANYDRTLSWATEEFDRIRAEIDELNRENDRFAIMMTTADDQEVALPLGEVVRAYPANQLNWLEKVRVYVSRWHEFLTDDPREANTEGGVLPPIVGTVTMTLLMCFIVAPFGVLAALYLREYARAGPIVSAVRIAVNNLAGVPSIVFGVFGLGFFCYMVGGYVDRGPSNPTTTGPWLAALGLLVVLALLAASMTVVKLRTNDERQLGARMLGWAAVTLWLISVAVLVWMVIRVPFFDGFFAARAADGSPTFGKGGVLWASLTLALLTLPVVIVATEEALAAVPGSMREGSYACGASKWQTVRRIVLPRAMPGIMTGMILAMARGAGEVAPLMLVGAVTMAPELPVDNHFPYVHLDRSFMHLGFHIYDVGFQSPDSESAKPMVYTTTLLLIAIIATLNMAAFYLRTRLRRRFAESKF